MVEEKIEKKAEEAKAAEKPAVKASAKKTEAKTENQVAAEKPPVKTEKKTEKKPAKAKPKAEKKAEKPKAKTTIEKSDTVKAMKKLKEKQPSKPTFRGRFGNRSVRKKSNPKWDKWRVPRGIDVTRHAREDGRIPQPGYGIDARVRGIHPSGYKDILIFNVKGLEAINKEIEAARISGTVGKRKRIEIVKKAKELKIKVLNR